jgi:hypothetical protein
MKTRNERIAALVLAAVGGIANAQPVEPGPDVDAGTGTRVQRRCGNWAWAWPA